MRFIPRVRLIAVWAFCLVWLLIVGLPAGQAETGGLEFTLPASPLPWAIVGFSLAGLIVTAGCIFYLTRILLGDRTIQVKADKRQLIEKGFSEKLSEEYRKKDEAIKQGFKDLKSRFSMIFLKIRNLTSNLDPEEIFKAIMDLISQEAEASKFILFLHDPVKNELYSYKWLGFGDKKKISIVLPVEKQHLLTVAFKKRLVIDKYRAIEDPLLGGVIGMEPLKDLLVAIPIATAKESLGIICIEAFKEGKEAISDDDLRFFAALSTFMGMALSNANILLQTRDELSSTKLLTEKELAEKKRLKDIFSKYASSELIDTLLQNPGSIKLGGTLKEASILFADIAGFTHFSSKLSPVEVVATMNEYLSIMAEVVLNHEGEVDKFIGDAVMARFGVLVDLPSPGLAAVKTALAMLDELKKLHARWAMEKRECFNIRIGIASGPVLAGNIGSERRQEFTVMGTTVNLASRLEGLNKELKTTLLIDERTFQQISQEIRAIPRENIAIRGMEGTMTVYEVLGFHEQAHQQKSNIISLRDKISSSKIKLIPEKQTGEEKPQENLEKKTSDTAFPQGKNEKPS